jgi:hypothetical protein
VGGLKGGDEQKTSQPLPGFEPSIIQPVTQRYTAELPRLLVYGEETEMMMVIRFQLGALMANAAPGATLLNTAKVSKVSLDSTSCSDLPTDADGSLPLVFSRYIRYSHFNKLE